MDCDHLSFPTHSLWTETHLHQNINSLLVPVDQIAEQYWLLQYKPLWEWALITLRPWLSNYRAASLLLTAAAEEK